jgi:dUTP pyrophosphatase
VKVILINHGREAFAIARGAKIAQLVVAAHARVDWREERTLSGTSRGEGGFGSTGYRVGSN